MWKFFLFALIPASLLSSGALRADEKTESRLIDYVGKDAGLYVEISDLNRRIPKLANSKLFARVEALPIYVAWKHSPEFRKLEAIKDAIERQTGQPLRQFAMNLFGQSVVFAVYPKDAGNPAGVLLLQAADAESLENSLALWNREEGVKIEPVPFSDSRYFKRTQVKQNQAGRPQFYFVREEIFAVSDEETLIQDIVRRNLGQSAQAPLSGHENYLLARNSLPEGSWAVLYFDPQSWRSRWELDAGRTKTEQFVAGFWKRCRAVAAGLRADRGLAVDVVLHYDPEQIPERWRRLVERTQGFPKFLNQVPEGVFLVFAGKQDLAGIDKILTAEMDEPARRRWQNARQIGRGLLLGLDLFDDVLPTFRPNWGLYVLPREPLDPDALPVEGLFAVELPPIPEDKNPITVRKAVENALTTGFNILAATQNGEAGDPAVVKLEGESPGQLHWLESIGPYRPAFCLSSEYLVFASSPKVIREFLSPDVPKLAQSRVFRSWADRQDPPEGQLLFVNWQAIREFMAKNYDFLLKQAVDSHALEEEEAEKRLKRLRDVLEVLDGVYLGIQIQEDRIHITTGGITAE